MALSDSSRFFRTKLTDLMLIAKDFTQHFEGQGYSVSTEKTISGAMFSITKGGMFTTVVGLKTALNIDLELVEEGIKVSMKVGAFGAQILPTALTLFVAWPVVVPQIMGLIKQNKLDGEAYDVIETAIRRYEDSSVAVGTQFCTSCGTSVPEGSVFCTNCGKRVSEDISCPSCGARTVPGAAFCSQCGAKLN